MLHPPLNCTKLYTDFGGIFRRSVAFLQQCSILYIDTLYQYSILDTQYSILGSGVRRFWGLDSRTRRIHKQLCRRNNSPVDNTSAHCPYAPMLRSTYSRHRPSHTTTRGNTPGRGRKRLRENLQSAQIIYISKTNLRKFYSCTVALCCFCYVCRFCNIFFLTYCGGGCILWLWG